jgi:toxin ParE1/3/4
MGNYSLSRRAADGLSTIWNYTFEVWLESQADRYYFLTTDCCQEIANNSIAGKEYSEISKGLLGIKVGKHIIFYRKTPGMEPK